MGLLKGQSWELARGLQCLEASPELPQSLMPPSTQSCSSTPTLEKEDPAHGHGQLESELSACPSQVPAPCTQLAGESQCFHSQAGGRMGKSSYVLSIMAWVDLLVHELEEAHEGGIMGLHVTI